MEEEYKDLILYVDDEPENLEGFRYTFRKHYQILVAPSGMEALDILASNPVKVIISDQRMPVMTGTELLEKVATSYPDIIRVILTAYTDIDVVINAVNKGQIYRFLSKPWNKDDLKSTIDSALDIFNLKKENALLLGELQQTNKELTDYKDHLEDLVSKRTEELKQLNEEYIVLNEELQQTNEELQSSNESLSKEIEERNKIQELLEESEEKLRSFIEQSFDGITIVNSEGKIIEWNQKMSDIFKVKKEDVIGTYSWDFEYNRMIPEKKSPLLFDKIKASVLGYVHNKNIKPFVLEGEVLNYKNEPISLSVSIFPIKTKNETLVGRISRDITEKVQILKELDRYRNHLELIVEEKTQELFDTEYRLKTLSDNLPGGAVFRASKKPGEDFVFEYLIASFYSITGIPDYKNRMDKTTSDFFNRIETPEQEKILALIEESTQQVTELLYDFTFNKKEKQQVWLQFRAMPIETEDRGIIFDGLILDNTSRKEAEEKLYETSLLLESTLNAIPDIIGVQNPDHTIIRYNKAGYDLLNLTEEEVKNKKCYELIGRKNECQDCATTHACETKKPSQVIRYDDTLNAWVDVRSYPIIDDKGKVIKVIEHLRDITAQKNAEKALKISEEKYRLLAENASDMISLHDKKTVFEYVSPACIKLTGYQPEELTGKSALEFHHPEDLQVIIDHHEKIKSNADNNMAVEYRFRKKDGTYIWLESKSELLDAHDPEQKVVVISRDITERRKIMNQIKQASDIYNNIQIGMHIYCLENINDDHSLIMMSANPASETHTGIKVKDIVGKSIDQNFPGLRDKGIPQLYADVVRNQKPTEIEDIYYADDRVIAGAFNVRAFPLPENHVGIAFENITNKKKIEAELFFKSEFEKLIFDISSKFINIPLEEIDNNITIALEEMARFFMNDTVCILETHPKRIELTLSYFWSDMSQAPDKLYIALDRVDQLWLNEFGPSNLVKMVNINHLEQEPPVLMKIIKDLSLTGAVIIPLTFQNNLTGLIIYGNTEKKIDNTINDISFYTISSQVFLNAILRKKNELDFRESQEKFRAVFDQAFQLVGMLDTSGKVLEANKTALDFAGIKLEEVKGKYFFDTPWWTHSEQEQNKLKDSLKKAMKGELVRMETTHIAKDGTTHYIDFTIKPITDNVGNIRLLIPEGRDITERIVAQRREREQLEFMNILIETVPIPIFYKNTKGEYIGFNSVFEKYTGYKREQLIGKKVQNLYDKEFADIYEKMDNELFETVRQQRYESKMKYADGSIRDVIYHKASYTDAEGNILGLIGVMFDVTDIRNAEGEIKANEQKFRDLFNNSSDSIIISDFDGNILESNNEFSRLTGFAKEDIRTIRTANIYTSEYLPLINDRIKSLKKNVPVNDIEVELVSHNATCIPVEIGCKVIDYEGKKAILTIARNISDRKEIERKLFDTIIETEEKERQRLARDLHDEIGPILSSLKMYISSLSESMDDKKKQYIITQVQELVKEAINSVREISNALSPHILTNYGLHAALKLIIENAQQFVTIEYKSNIQDRRLPANIEIVYFRIIRELINNSLKHAKADLINISILYNKGFLNLEYADNGIGFDIENTLHNKKHGMGLFNILSRIKTIDGSYSFDDKVEKGFKFYLSNKTNIIL